MPEWMPRRAKFAPYFALAVGDPDVADEREPEAAADGVTVECADRSAPRCRAPRETGHTRRRRARAAADPRPPLLRRTPLADVRKSAPAQKLLPRPVMTTARTSRSSRTCAIASPKPASTSGVMLLRFSGRFSVIVATCRSLSYRRRRFSLMHLRLPRTPSAPSPPAAAPWSRTARSTASASRAESARCTAQAKSQRAGRRSSKRSS